MGLVKHISARDFNKDGVKDILLFNGSSPLNPNYGKPDSRAFHIITSQLINGQWFPKSTSSYFSSGSISSVCPLPKSKSLSNSYIIGYEDGNIELITINTN